MSSVKPAPLEKSCTIKDTSQTEGTEIKDKRSHTIYIIFSITKWPSLIQNLSLSSWQRLQKLKRNVCRRVTTQGT